MGETSSFLAQLQEPRAIYYVLVGLVAAWFIVFWSRKFGITAWQLFVGFITNFFDWFGIGSFATTTSLYRARRTIDDRLLPGTLNVGHTLPTVAEAFISATLFKVETTTLISMTAAAVLGSWLGAGVVARWSRRKVQIGMGIALIVVAAIMAYRTAKGDPKGREDVFGVSGLRLMIGVTGNFVLGALMTLGIGLFAPCLLLVGMLGMSFETGFPIMMGSCAFLMPIASARFVQKNSYALRPSLGLSLAGVPAVLIAALIVKSLPLTTIRWLVVVVVLYTSISMLRSYRASAAEPATSAA